MFDELVGRYRDWRRRLRRTDLADLSPSTRRVLTIGRFQYLTAFVFVPALIAILIFVSNTVDALSFLLFPPLAAAAYELFANPGKPSSTAEGMVVGMTGGALSGWAAVTLDRALFGPSPAGTFEVSVTAAVMCVLITGVVLWLFDVDLAPSFAVALLVLLLDIPPEAYVLSVFLASSLIAGVFLVWHRRIYERRATHLYAATDGSGNVLLSLRRAGTRAVTRLAAQISAGHRSSKLLLLEPAETEPESTGGDAAASVSRLERVAEDVEPEVETISADEPDLRDGGEAATTRRRAHEANCDLVVVPYETADGGLSPFVRRLFDGDVDVIVARISGPPERWDRVLVLVRRAGRIAHAMVEYARRLAGTNGRVSICTCIETESERRSAEQTCAILAEAFAGQFETRVANESIETFLESNAPKYDLVCIGASTDRSRASRFLSAPTFRRVEDLDCDLAIVHRG